MKRLFSALGEIIFAFAILLTCVEILLGIATTGIAASEKHPELIPYGLAVLAGSALVAEGLAFGARRRYLGMAAVVVGAVPGFPLVAFSVLGFVPYLLVPVGVLAVLLRSLSNRRLAAVSP